MSAYCSSRSVNPKRVLAEALIEHSFPQMLAKKMSRSLPGKTGSSTAFLPCRVWCPSHWSNAEDYAAGFWNCSWTWAWKSPSRAAYTDSKTTITQNMTAKVKYEAAKREGNKKRSENVVHGVFQKASSKRTASWVWSGQNRLRTNS